jgi:hypothetical protein
MFLICVTNSTTPASRAARLAATRRQEAKRKADGWRKVTVWLPPDAVARLDRLAEWHGGIGAAIEAALSTKNIGVLK